jgi:hypothetical protein
MRWPEDMRSVKSMIEQSQRPSMRLGPYVSIRQIPISDRAINWYQEELRKILAKGNQQIKIGGLH